MRFSRVVGFLISFLGFQCIQASGQQVVATWTDGSGFWQDPANWSTLTVPNNGGGVTYSVIIDTPNAVVINAAGTIDNLTLGATDTLEPVGLSLVSGMSSSSGAIGFLGATVTIGSSASLINNGAIGGSNFSDVVNSGTFINNGTVTVDIDSSVGNTAGAYFANSGRITVEAASIGNGGTFNNSGTVSVTAVSDPAAFSNSRVFNNSGTMLVDLRDWNDSSFSNSGTINNSGTMAVDGSCAFCNHPPSSSGTINNSGTLNTDVEVGSAFGASFAKQQRHTQQLRCFWQWHPQQLRHF